MTAFAIRTDRTSDRSDDCSLCNAPHPAADGSTPAQQRLDLVPWAVVLTAAVVIAGIGAEAERWFGVGATAGLLAGVACAWVSFQAARRGRGTEHARELATLAEDADMRVQGVIKQFEWAVQDVVKLKKDAERAQGAADALMERARERERYVKKLERQLFELREQLAHAPQAGTDSVALEPQFDGPEPTHVPFRWALHVADGKSTLELETGVTLDRPSRVRVLDRDGQVVCVSGVPVVLAEGGYGFTIAEPPADLVSDLAAKRTPNYLVEALVQYEWKPTRIEDSGRRTTASTDKKGRYFRQTDSPDTAQAVASSPRRSGLN
jgi:hypothetical protein